MLPIRTILQPTDFSEHSSYAFEFACALARDYGANIVLLHVFPTPVLPTLSGAPLPVSLDVPRAELMESLNNMKPIDPKITIERVLVAGDPAHEIQRVAEVYGADLIVMGTHGRGGLSRFVMGSVAEDVSRHANCPVLTVRTKFGLVRAELSQAAQAEPAAIS